MQCVFFNLLKHIFELFSFFNLNVFGTYICALGRKSSTFWNQF